MNPIHILLALLLGVGFVMAAGIALGMWAARRWLGPSTFEVRPSTCTFVRAWPPLDDMKLRLALAGWNDTDPRWRALWDLLSREMEANLASLTTTTSDPQELARFAGRLEQVFQIREQLLVFRGKPPEE